MHLERAGSLTVLSRWTRMRKPQTNRRYQRPFSLLGWQRLLQLMQLASNYSLPVPTLTSLTSLTFTCLLLSDFPFLLPMRPSLVHLPHFVRVCPLISISYLQPSDRAGDCVLRMLAGPE